jgi:YggT family protein
MFIFLFKLLSFIDWLLFLYMWIVIIAAVLTWIRPDPYNPIVRFFYAVTEPILARIRRLLPIRGVGLDLAPLLLILLIVLLRKVVLVELVLYLLTP